MLLVIVQHRRALAHGLFRIEERRQLMVSCLDGFRRLLSDLLRLRGDDRYPIAHEPYLLVEQDRVVGGRFGVTLTGGGMPYPRHVFVGQDVDHTGDLLRFTRVNIDDFGVGIGGIKDLQMQRVFERIIVGKQRGPRRQGQGVYLLDVLANVLKIIHFPSSFWRPIGRPR